MEMVNFETLEDKILEIRSKKVLIDKDLAELYGVETRDINKAVKNNPDKFPNETYVFELSKNEKKKCGGKFPPPLFIKVFTAYSKSFYRKRLVYACNNLESDESETTIEMNLAFLKFKHTIKKSKI